VRDSLNDVLLAEGYLIIPAEDGQQALDLANKSPVDLVLLDLNMPVKNGWDTFERLTAEHPLIPIIIATARPNQLFTALNAGEGALLEKPMDIRTLLQTMEKLLAESAEQRLARLAGKNSEFTYKPARGAMRRKPPILSSIMKTRHLLAPLGDVLRRRPGGLRQLRSSDVRVRPDEKNLERDEAPSSTGLSQPVDSGRGAFRKLDLDTNGAVTLDEWRHFETNAVAKDNFSTLVEDGNGRST